MKTHNLVVLVASVLLLVAVPVARAAFGDTYGITDAVGPAWTSDKAWWTGTCDLESASTGNGGAGSPPPRFAHCIDHGRPYRVAPVENPSPPRETVWDTGDAPAWRLNSLSQAGGHPDATASSWLNRQPAIVNGTPVQADGDTRTVVVALPPGVLGNPNAVPQCPSDALRVVPAACHPNSQIGTVTLTLATGAPTAPLDTSVYPVWNTEPRDGKTAEFMLYAGAGAERVNIPIVASARTDGDFGVDAIAMNLPTGSSLLGQTVTLWGVPWASSHDAYRPVTGYVGHTDPVTGQGLAGMPESGLTGTNDLGEPSPKQEPQSYDPSWGPVRPFFSNPTACTPTGGTPPVTTLRINSWQNPDEVHAYDAVAEPVDGCELLSFEPAIEIRPTVTSGDSPSGLDVDLEIPQNNDLPFEPPVEGASQAEIDDYVAAAAAYWKSEAGLAVPNLKETVVRLPEGVSINPAAANGQSACSTAQIGLTTVQGAMPAPIRFDNSDPSDGIGNDCPDAAKVATVEVETPLLEKADWPAGEVYLAAQNDNPFGSLLAIYIVVRSPQRGLIVKLAGEVTPDPQTGQLETRFRNSPQLPFGRFELHFKGGPGGPLATPVTCGAFTNHTELTPWSADGPAGTVAVDRAEFEISSGPNGSACPPSKAARPLDLGFEAGSANPIAGAHSPFAVHVRRPDGNQELDRIEVTTPEGFAATLAGVPSCPEAAIALAVSRTRAGDGAVEEASPSCPAASQVGTTRIGAGAGSSPVFVAGKVYLGGPYKGAPLSLAFVVPAVAGPFDLGVQVVRAALNVNPTNAQITTVSDRIPQILAGIPLRIRDIRVDIDRPGFSLNPTDCSEQLVTAKVYGASGGVASLSNRFQVGNCEALGFKPRLALKFFGGTKRGDFQRLRAVVRARPGDANIARAAVTLPHSAFLAQQHINTICTRVQFAADACPTGSVYGKAVAISPLLDQPLAGPVYLRSSNNPLPDLVAALKGPAHQPIEIELAGRTDSKNEGIRNTFDVIPDAPVSSFTLELKGGRKSLIENSTDICKQVRRATVRLKAQNGRSHNFRTAVTNPKCKKVRKATRRIDDR